MLKILHMHFLKPGLQTLVQDAGRLDHQAFGVPVGGAMDRRSAQLANVLVGNPLEAPVLEMVMVGPKIEFEGKGQIALCGADLSPSLNGEDVDMYTTLEVQEGDILSFGRMRGGCRAYLAVGGTWDMKSWLGSYSAANYLPRLTPNSWIQKGSHLSIHPRPFIQHQYISKDYWPNFSSHWDIRILPGPEFEDFSRSQIAEFFSRDHVIENDSNRMGYRLGKEIQGFQPHKEVISSGILPGTIQITRSGKPIILMADAQTSGGYFRIANVITADMNALGQAKPTDTIRFKITSLAEAQVALRNERDAFENLLKSISTS